MNLVASEKILSTASIMYRFNRSLQIFRFNHSNCLKFRPFSTRFENVGPMACHLESRSVIRFRGPDTVKFLQGLVTNDVQKLSDSAGKTANSYPLPTPNLPVTIVPPVYAALLTPHGRFLYDMFLYRPPRPDEKLDSTGLSPAPGPNPEEFELFADVDRSSLDELLQTLNKYRLRLKVEIENLADEFSCWQRFGSNSNKESTSIEGGEASSVGYGGGVDLVGISSSLGSRCGWQWYTDPRLDYLGNRGIFPSDAEPPDVEIDEKTTEDNFLIWRFEKGVAEGPSEIPKGEAIPLEYNLVGLNAISFDKGCYVGQELVARTHHVGTIRKRLFPLKFSNNNEKDFESKVGPKSTIIESGSEKKVGIVNAAVGNRGLGLLRLDEAFKSSESLIVHGQNDVKVEFSVPEWWPTKWYGDYNQRHSTAV